MRGTMPAKLKLHLEIGRVLEEKGLGPEADAALALCPDAECEQCAFLACPHGDFMHFHHDGCPSCAEAERGK